MKQKHLLTQVPLVGFAREGRFPESVAFLGCLNPIIEFTGHSKRFKTLPLTTKYSHSPDYTIISATSGNSFGYEFMENPFIGIEGKGDDLRYLRAFAGCGFTPVFLRQGQNVDKTSSILSDLCQRLLQGYPVLAQIGDDESNWCYINGWEEFGKVLTGRGYYAQQMMEFGARTKKDGYFRLRNWEQNIKTFLFPGNYTGAPSFTESLAIVLPVLKEADHEGYLTALKSLIGQSEGQIHTDESFLSEAYLFYINDIGLLAENRNSAIYYLSLLIKEMPKMSKSKESPPMQ
jgi:hypothetical protein